MELSKDFKEFIELLNANKVKYLVVGGYAVGYHGHPRYTKDIDLWILMKRSNAENVINAVKEFGFESLGLTEDDFLDTENIIQLGFPPNRIDILTDIAGVDFETCFNNKVVVEFEGSEINFISLIDLITNKEAAGRLQDLADAEKLKKLNK
ncbi:MAG: nucleotidyltransferase [Candidatus Methylacidiphilales bacterium]